MPTERNNRQSSEISDSKVEEVAKIASEVWKRTGWGDGEPELAEGRLCLESVKAGYEAAKRETRRETLLEAAKGLRELAGPITALRFDEEVGATVEGDKYYDPGMLRAAAELERKAKEEM